MLQIHRRDVRRWGRQILSFLLIAAMILGLIPQSAYASAAEATAKVAEKTYESEDCVITYKESSAWGNYVNADITIKNEGKNQQANWKLSLIFDGTIDNIWNADVLSSENGSCIIGAKTYNSVIEPGQSVSFGFQAYGADGKPAAPEEIKLVKDTPSQDETDNKDDRDDKGDSGSLQGSSYTIPDKWKGLNYALFTSGEQKLSLYTAQTNITGSVHSNKDFYYQGTTLSVDGVLEAAGDIDVKTASGEDCCKISYEKEQAETLAMPDITKEVSAYVKENGKVYDKTTDFQSDSIVVDNPIFIEGNAAFHSTYFLGSGIIYATDSVTYNVGDLATPENSRVFVASENGNITLNGSDITLNAVLYAPNGCVTINANKVNLNGRIIAKQVCINGTIININAGPYDLDMLDFLFKPEIAIVSAGNQKENRKVTLDVEEILNTEYIIKEDTVWKITQKVEAEEASDCYAIDEENSNDFHKEMLFTKAGTYEVSVTVTTGKVEHTVTKELVIEKDLKPVASFTLPTEYFGRDEEGSAVIELTDSSCSLDNDAIGQRIWTIYYDKNNDGTFAEDEAEVISDENKTEINYQTYKVGKYKVVLRVIENFTDTIPKLLGEDAYREDDTTELEDSACVFEVGNEAPQAKVDVQKSKSADIVFTVGDTDKETLDAYNAKAETLKKILKEKGVDAKIDAISTSTLTAQDTFAWKEYSHSNCDGYPEHIIYEEENIKMVGYYSSPKKDFLYIANDNPGQKTFEFDLQRDRTDWHSMEGGGFLFNTTVDDENDTIKGFCILVSQQGLKLVQIDCKRLKYFRDGGYNWVQHAGRLLGTYSIGNVYDSHHFKIVVDKKSISVWDGDKLVIDDYVLPENDYGYGFGPITSHASHGCGQRSYFTFKNITMQTMTGSSLSDIVDGYDWRAGASHYVINLSKTEVPELSYDEETADLAAALIENQAAFIGIGNDTNQNQYHGLLAATETGGMVQSADEIGTSMDTVNKWITNTILAKDYSIEKYITTDDIVAYEGYYQDAENDEIYEQRWEYEYDPSVFGEKGETEHIVRKENKPITVFEDTGAYQIRLNIRDNPAGDNDALDSYRKWSGTEEYEKLLIVQSRPQAEVSVDVAKDEKDFTQCIANASYSAKDADHPEDAKKGIREEYFHYKNVKDAGWTEGKLPNRLTIGETYLVKYQVKDVEGTLSFPAVAVVKTSDLRTFEKIEDNLPPEVYIDAAKTEIRVGEELRIDGYAIDDYGVESFTMSIDGKKVLDSFGRVLYTPDKAGTITVEATATDIGGNTAKKELTITVVDERDKTAPTAVITSPAAGSELGFDVPIIGTAEDEAKLAGYTLSYRGEKETEYHVFRESNSPVHEDILGTLNIEDFADGTYEILLTVKDAAGNVSHCGLLLYIETGVTREYVLQASIDDAKMNEKADAVDIYGLVSADGHLKKYTLSYQYNGEGDMVTIATGTKEVKDGLLGSIPINGLASGAYNLLLTIEDENGNTGSACGGFTYTAGSTGGEGSEGGSIEADLIAPDAMITGLRLSDDKEQVEIKGTAKDDKKLAGWLLEYREKDKGDFKELAAGTEPVEDVPLANLATKKLEGGAYQLRLSAWDAYGNSYVYTMEFTYKKGSSEGGSGEGSGTGGEGETGGSSIEIGGTGSTEKPVEKQFAVNLSHSAAGTRTTVQVQVTLPENVKEESVKIFMQNNPAGQSTQEPDKEELATGTRKASFTSDKAGRVTITAEGVTEDGKTVTAEASCTFYNLKDKNPPTVEITSPTIDTVLTEPVDIVGSAYDDEELDFWKLEYQMTGEKEWLPLAEGKEAVKDGVLGHFDTTMLMNGQYTIKLTVQDTGGNIRRLENDYVVEGELKVGAMHIGFTDITASLGGTTVNINRMYDSRDKTKGEFGYGWTLGMQGMEIYENENISEGYELVKTGSLFSTGYQMKETLNHDVIVSYGDGSSERFEITFSPERKALIPISEVKIGYRCLTNPKVKLEIIGDTTAYVGGGQLVFLDEEMYEPLSYKLTTEEGTEIYLNKKKGVYKIEDNNGNVITVDKNGYHSKDGKSVTLERDSEDRVVSATDSAGNITNYAYDSAGNLVSVTDPAGRTVSFAYDKKHNLISMTDPMGVAVARNEYDDDGRLIATIDADGKRMEYDYDVEGRTQSVKDRRGNTTVYTYDDNGNVVQTVDAYGNKTTNTYDKSNNLLFTTDANGNTTGYAYDKSGNVTKVTAADGTTVDSTYTQENLVSSIQMMDKTVMAMEYDDKGRITSVEDSNGNETEYSYTGDGKLTGLTDAIGTYQKVTYDSEGNVASTTNGAGESASYTYDKDGKVTSVTISREDDGKTLTFTSHYSYNAAGDITESIDNAGNVIKYEYDDNGNQTASIDAKGRRITYEYDDLGNMTKTAYPDGTFESFTYDANGNNITATDRSGLTVTMKYDKLNRMTEKAYADGTKETYAYDAVGNVTEQTSTSGAKTMYVYDERNRNTSITDALGNVTTFAYDEAARLTSRTDAKGNSISYEYDDNGNITKTTYADGNSVSSKYDARNRVTEQKDQNGNVIKYTYDGADRLTGVTDAYGNSYTYGYDGNGNLVTVTDAEEHVTHYAYDALGRVAKVTNALGKTMEYSYDETGNLTQFKDYAGTLTKYSYDDMDRMVKKTVGKDVTEYSYDKKGLLLAVTDQSGTVKYQYDKYDRLAKQTDVNGITLSYTYDKAGRVSGFDNGFGKTAYEYDLLDRVTRVVDRNGKATVYEYDELGNRSAVKYPNGNIMTYTYDACQRLKEEWVTDANSVTLAKYSYGLGKAGERLTITESDGISETETTYQYDKLNRLVKETIAKDGNKLTNEYSYNKVSNRISKETKVKGELSALANTDSQEVQVEEGRTTYTYNALNQLVTEESPEGSITYTYDANGNLVKQSGSKTVDYSYDKKNHLLRATIQQGNSVTIESYSYDYAGNRLSKTVNESNTTYYVNDTSGSLTQVVAETDKDGKETASYTRGDELLFMERGGEIWYYIYDGHGSTRLLTNEAGQITDRYAYDACGNLLQKEGDTENDFLYTGEQYNANTELYYLRARYMDPSTGTFISMDSYQGSIYDPVSLHKYLYANANPVTYTDPSGYFSLVECSIAEGIQSTLNSIHQLNSLRNIIKWANAMTTIYDTAIEIRGVIFGEKSVVDVIGALLKGVVVGFMCDGMCKTALGVVLKPMMAIFGLGSQVDQIQEAIKSGDPAEIAVRFVQLICMLFGLTSQCFTGDTLVSTEDGLRPIEEIQAGDYVWSENTETGEKELKKVFYVSVTETTALVHVTTENGTVINTTENHPFYVEEKGWCAAADLEDGDVLRTQDGETETVESVQIENLDEAVKVYNLEIEDSHTYYVSADEVLVHNECTKNNYRSEYIKENPGMPNEYQVHHTLPQKYSDLFEGTDINIHDVENLRGVPRDIHTMITNMWGNWDRNLDHSPDKDDVIEFAQTIDKLFETFWYKEN